MEGVAALDSNILVYALDPMLPEHARAVRAILGLNGLCLNPTVLHETYHTLVFKRKMSPVDARIKIMEVLEDDRTLFSNQTRTITELCLRMAVKHNLGGRDALIIGCYLCSGMPVMLTHDDQILSLGTLSFEMHRMEFKDPIGSSV
jgi:predicted nucleic acid-binding protein